jgi:hypothetical protein
MAQLPRISARVDTTHCEMYSLLSMGSIMNSNTSKNRDQYTKVVVYFTMVRILEIYLIGAKFLMGLVIVLPLRHHPEYIAYVQKDWPKWLAAAPWFFLAIVQSIPVIIDHQNHHRFPHVFRIIGAIFGMYFWSWILIKLYLVHFMGSGLTPFGIMSFFASAVLMLTGFVGIFRIENTK